MGYSRLCDGSSVSRRTFVEERDASAHLFEGNLVGMDMPTCPACVARAQEISAANAAAAEKRAARAAAKSAAIAADLAANPAPPPSGCGLPDPYGFRAAAERRELGDYQDWAFHRE